MATEFVHIAISFDALVAAIEGLDLADKQRLLDMLEAQVGQAEENAWEADPAVSAEMRKARNEYASGDYMSLDDYTAGQSDETKSAS
ncbi:MAG: hypothetical protein ACRDHE_14620 [Ktedonobacterales bacterium]